MAVLQRRVAKYLYHSLALPFSSLCSGRYPWPNLSEGSQRTLFVACFSGIHGRTSATGRGVPYTTPSNTLLFLLFRAVSMAASQRGVAAYCTPLTLTLCYFFFVHTLLCLLFRAVSMAAPQRRVAAYRTPLPLTLSYFFCSGRYPWSELVAPQRMVAAYRTPLPLTLCYVFCLGRYPWSHLSDGSRRVPRPGELHP
jgi:hypothetical protein